MSHASRTLCSNAPCGLVALRDAHSPVDLPKRASQQPSWASVWTNHAWPLQGFTRPTVVRLRALRARWSGNSVRPPVHTLCGTHEQSLRAARLAARDSVCSLDRCLSRLVCFRRHACVSLIVLRSSRVGVVASIWLSDIFVRVFQWDVGLAVASDLAAVCCTWAHLAYPYERVCACSASDAIRHSVHADVAIHLSLEPYSVSRERFWGSSSACGGLLNCVCSPDARAEGFRRVRAAGRAPRSARE
jgi:hypothetical protein